MSKVNNGNYRRRGEFHILIKTKKVSNSNAKSKEERNKIENRQQTFILACKKALKYMIYYKIKSKLYGYSFSTTGTFKFEKH